MPSLAYGKLRNYAVRICHMGPFAAKECHWYILSLVLEHSACDTKGKVGVFLTTGSSKLSNIQLVLSFSKGH
ncbi:hypothetical protein EMCRGX_G011189 [Ephydatia muelleri]